MYRLLLVLALLKRDRFRVAIEQTFEELPIAFLRDASLLSGSFMCERYTRNDNIYLNLHDCFKEFFEFKSL
ncbi:MAG: hypothetical protein KME31_12910 [Tolypothrix carrinoi HA7290-LM1]|nr:hypothetical protein [Tolypothrix carrinoi HA7290-LM1]